MAKVTLNDGKCIQTMASDQKLGFIAYKLEFEVKKKSSMFNIPP